MRAFLIPGTHSIPDNAAITAHYAAPAGSSLMTATAGMPELHVPRLAVIPARWAPFFLNRKSPKEALDMMASLVAGLATQPQRDAMDPLMDWCKSSCVREGGMGEARQRSTLNAEWENPPIQDDRFSRWAKGRLVKITLPEPAAPAQVPPPAAAAPLVIDTSDKRNYSEMEHDRIRSACSLTCAQYEQAGLVPNIYIKMLTEGRTTSKVAKVLHEALRPTDDEDTPVNIFVSADLAKDIKELNLGYGNDKSFDSCHRGISPFGVLAVSQETASFRRRAAERAQHAMMLSMEDVTSMESGPGPCPTTYDGLLRLLLA